MISIIEHSNLEQSTFTQDSRKNQSINIFSLLLWSSSMFCDLPIMFFLVERIHFIVCSVIIYPDGCDTLKIVLIILDTYATEMNCLHFYPLLCHTLQTSDNKIKYFTSTLNE